MDAEKQTTEGARLMAGMLEATGNPKTAAMLRAQAAEIERLRAALAEAQRLAREWDEYHPAFIAGAKAAAAAAAELGVGNSPATP